MEYKGLTINITQDEHFDFDPRTEYDNLGTMYCKHRRYKLGDVGAQSPFEPRFILGEAVNFNIQYRRDDVAVVLPLYLYDHGGLVMRTTPYECPWDSGQVGWIYITKAKVLSEYGWKRITKSRRAKLIKYLTCEVETYSQYLSGEIYYYAIKDDDGFVLDSLGGLFGYDYAEEEAMRAAEYEFGKQIENVKECLDDQTRYTMAQLKKSVRVEERLVTYAERS